MSRLLFAPLAESDLDEITNYIKAEDPFAARRWFDGIIGKCRLLSDNPRIGRPRNFLLSGLSVLAAGNYLIVYRALADGVEIVRVIDGRRDLPRFFADSDQ